MDAKNFEHKTPNEAASPEFDQPVGWLTVWIFLVPLVLVVGIAISGVLR